MYISLWLNLALCKQCPPTFIYTYLFYVFGNLKQEAYIDWKTSILWLSALDFKKATHENLFQFLIFSDIVFCFSLTIRNQK
jgi:hypothetical protein